MRYTQSAARQIFFYLCSPAKTKHDPQIEGAALQGAGKSPIVVHYFRRQAGDIKFRAEIRLKLPIHKLHRGAIRFGEEDVDSYGVRITVTHNVQKTRYKMPRPRPLPVTD